MNTLCFIRNQTGLLISFKYSNVGYKVPINTTVWMMLLIYTRLGDNKCVVCDQQKVAEGNGEAATARTTAGIYGEQQPDQGMAAVI